MHVSTARAADTGGARGRVRSDENAMTAARSLDTAETGETITVGRILFDTLRSHCSQRGVREGARVRIRAGDAERLELETAGGRAVPCERRYARFIQVTTGQSTPLAAERAAEASGGERGDDGTGA